MLDAVVNMLLAGIYLKAQTTGAINISTAVNNLPVAEVRAPAVPVKNFDFNSLGVKVSARSYLVIEPESGAILYQKNCQDVRSIASITKLMTALVFLDHNPGWDKEVSILAGDYRSGGITQLIAGDKITVKDVFYTTLIASSNEGAAALARVTGLSSKDFVAAMNDKARELGMTKTNFTEPTGLDNDNVSTAEDIVKLTAAALAQPEIRQAAKSKDYTIDILNKNHDRKVISTDKILGQEFGYSDNIFKIEAGKTGYLEAAGYCFTSEVTDKNNRRVLIAVLGSASINDRFQDTKSLAYWVFNNYKW